MKDHNRTFKDVAADAEADPARYGPLELEPRRQRCIHGERSMIVVGGPDADLGKIWHYDRAQGDDHHAVYVPCT